MSNYKSHAMLEFSAAGWIDEDGKFKDEMQGMICNHVLKLLEVFNDEGHSGSSAPYAIDLFSKLAKFDPIVPLTGEAWEWVEVGDGFWQNIRCSAVFKSADRFDGKPYYLDAVVFWEWVLDSDGRPSRAYFGSQDSIQPIEFPYTPKTVYQFRPTTQFPQEIL